MKEEITYVTHIYTNKLLYNILKVFCIVLYKIRMNTRNNEQCIISLVYYFFCKALYKNLYLPSMYGLLISVYVCMGMSVYMFIFLFNEIAITYLVFAIIS